MGADGSLQGQAVKTHLHPDQSKNAELRGETSRGAQLRAAAGGKPSLRRGSCSGAGLPACTTDVTRPPGGGGGRTRTPRYVVRRVHRGTAEVISLEYVHRHTPSSPKLETQKCP